MHLRTAFIFSVALLATPFTPAQDFKVKELVIENPYARATVPHQPTGGAYLSIENRGNTADKLLSVSTPVAKSVQIHTMRMDGNVMKMREVSNVEIGAGKKVEMKPGSGYHLMLMGLQKPLTAGDRFPLTLTFEKAGETEVSVTVKDPGATAAMATGMRHGHERQ